MKLSYYIYVYIYIYILNNNYKLIFKNRVLKYNSMLPIIRPLSQIFKVQSFFKNYQVIQNISDENRMK